MSSPWPPKEGVTTPTVSRKDAIITAKAAIHINAPASVVFETLTNIAEYPKWNTSFCPEATITTQPSTASGDTTHLHKGTVAKFKFLLTEKAIDTECTISDISTPEHPSDYIATDILNKDSVYTSDLSKTYRLACRMVGSALKSERIDEVVVLGENECQVRTWACWTGMIARGMKWGGFTGKTEARMQAYVTDLKKRAEQQFAVIVHEFKGDGEESCSVYLLHTAVDAGVTELYLGREVPA